jgi:hypothetical protein
MREIGSDQRRVDNIEEGSENWTWVYPVLVSVIVVASILWVVL